MQIGPAFGPPERFPQFNASRHLSMGRSIFGPCFDALLVISTVIIGSTHALSGALRFLLANPIQRQAQSIYPWSGGIVQNDPEGVPVAGAHLAHAMPQLDAVIAAGPPHGPA